MMDSYKNNKIKQWMNSPEYKDYVYSIDKIEKQAEEEIFKQKVHAHLIIAGAMIVILIISFWW